MSTTAVFDSSFYLSNNADVVLAISQGHFGSAQQHFDLFGGRELRNPNSTFDMNYYSVQNPDVLAAVSSGVFANAFAHFQQFGETENRAPSVTYATFDATGYLEANPDVAAAVTSGAIKSALEHYIAFGVTEGRAGSGVEAVVLNPGSTFTLTTNADTSFVSTSGDDTFVGNVIADNGTGTTVNAGDNLSGGGGTGDTLNVSVSGTSTGTVNVTALTLTDIENVLVSNFDANTNDAHDHVFNGSLFSGVTTVGMTSSSATGDTSFTNLASIANARMESGSGDLNTDFAAAAVSGSSDAQGLSLNGQTAGDFSTDGGIETLNVSSTSAAAASTLTSITATGVKTINIDADANFTVTNDLGATVTTVDASNSAASVSVGLGTADQTVTGGAGNDTIRMDGSTVDTSDAINAGAGTDKLQFTAAANVTSATNGAVLTNFETLEGFQDVTSDGDTVVSTVVAQDVSLLGFAPTLVGVSNFDQDQTSTSADNDDETATSGVNFTNLGADTDMSLSGFTIAGFDANDGVIMNFTATADLATDNASGDDINVTLGTGTAAMASVGTGTNTAFNLTLALADYETVNITSQGGANTVASLTSTDMTTLNVAGDKALTVSALTAAGLNTVNASTSTANVNVAALTLASTITGGSGNDTFTGGGNADVITGGAGADTLGGGGGNDSVTGDAGNDQITGGAGNDTLVGGDGNDTFADAALNVESVDGGAGDDTFTIATTSTLTSADTISGGDGTDTILFSEANANIDLTADVAALTNVTGVERFQISGMNGSDTLTVNDGVISAAGGNLTVSFTSAVTGANTVNASGVLSSSNIIQFTDAAGLATTYSIGNGQDSITMGDGNDGITLINNAYLSGSDAINGGAGTDTITLTNDTAATNTLSAAQLGALSNVETVTINHATDTNLVNYVATLTDAIVGANVVQGGTFTFGRDVGEDGTLKVTASDVSSTYKLSFAGGDGADTFIGGAGDDTIAGESGADSITGGAGNDTFDFITASNIGGADTITDMDFGTSSTAVDKIDINDLTTPNGGFDLKVIDSTGFAVDEDVVVITSQAFATTTAVDTFYETRSTAATGANNDVILIYQDTLGSVKLAMAVGADGAMSSADQGDEYTVTDLATLSGLNINTISTLVDIGDFVG